MKAQQGSGQRRQRSATAADLNLRDRLGAWRLSARLCALNAHSGRRDLMGFDGALDGKWRSSEFLWHV
jgi:hypothetical protein